MKHVPFLWRSLLPLLTFIVTHSLAGIEQTITLFIRDYPLPVCDPEKPLDLACSSRKILKKQLKNPIAGSIYALYGGYMTHTDRDGALIFPRKTQQYQFHVLIAPQAKPFFTVENTIGHWYLAPKTPYAFYTITRSNDIPSGLYIWQTRKEDLPTDRIIPPHTIHILAKPRTIFVPEGITITTPSPQIVLPTIYARETFDPIKNALYGITIKPFFGTVKKQFHQEPSGYATMLIP